MVVETLTVRMGSSSSDRLATCKAGFEGRTVDSGEFSGLVRATSNTAKLDVFHAVQS